jgi:hypothetical protein
MLFVFGTRRRAKVIGQLSYSCSTCKTAVTRSAVVLTTWFTLFVIPIFPVGKKYQIVCNTCGLRNNAVNDLLLQLKSWEKTGQFRAAANTAEV